MTLAAAFPAIQENDGGVDFRVGLQNQLFDQGFAIHGDGGMDDIGFHDQSTTQGPMA